MSDQGSRFAWLRLPGAAFLEPRTIRRGVTHQASEGWQGLYRLVHRLPRVPWVPLSPWALLLPAMMKP
jgi:hypothetical protein